MPEKPKAYDEMVKGAKNGDFNIDTYNNEAFDQFNEKALVPCENCGRTFLPDSLKRHMKGCATVAGGSNERRRSTLTRKSQLGQAGAEQLKKASPDIGALRPKALICYICGREYGSASLEIHLKTCRKKWDIEQEKKPEHLRRPCPEPP